MSTLDYFKEEGRQEEIKKNWQWKKLVVKNLLSADRFTIAEIANFVNVTEAFVYKVKATM